MIVVYVVGALLWSVVLLAVLRRVTEQRQARRIWLAQRAEAERLWQERENERIELLHAAQHVMLVAKLERIVQ